MAYLPDHTSESKYKDPKNNVDYYYLTSNRIKQPPQTIGESLQYLGPSLIITASIVGSGELIMTTTLGAKAGYVALWVIILSCMVKVAIQLEFGKHAIGTGESSLQAFNHLSGPVWKGANWSVWSWLVLKTIQLVQYGGIVGGVALALNMAVPDVPIWIWACLAGGSTGYLVYIGSYRTIEKFAIGLTALFSIFTIVCVLLLQMTPYHVEPGNLIEGIQFKLPLSAVGVAIAAFGITGVSADEIVSYPYWCLEKGYAAYTGPYDASPDWTERAKGWINVMYWDAFLSMVIYTVTTAAFYILGAAILHGSGEIPSGNAIISTLSRIYTESAGPAAMGIFLGGAIVVLFSTLFVACASGTRMYTDALAQVGVLDFFNKEQRRAWFNGFAWGLPVLWTVLYLAIQLPLMLVAAGGIALSILLLIILYAAFHFRYQRLVPELRPGKLYDCFFWLSFIAIAGVGVITLRNFI